MGNSRMQGAIDPKRTGITREGACVPTGENFFFDLEEQGGLLDTFSEKQEKRPRRFNFTRRSLNDWSK